MKFSLLILLFLFSFKSFAIEYKAQEIAKGYVIPWGIEFIDEDNLIVNEKNGAISLLNTKTKKKVPLLTIPDVNNSGQAGLLDVALSPRSTANKKELYFTYSKKTPLGNTVALAKANLINNKLADWEDVFVANAYSNTARHFGSRIAFINDNVFFTIGDRGVKNSAQDLKNHIGKIIRLNMDGSVPADNPYKASQGLTEIWTSGHRNPQGLFYDKPSKTLWSIEHGERGGDEINLIQKGKNYGWPKAAFGKEYWSSANVAKATSLPGMQDPLLVYDPSIAPSNMILYRGDKYPELKGKILAGALKLTHINVVSINNGKLKEYKRLFENDYERIRDITTSPAGFIYFSTDSGKIFRLEQVAENNKKKI